MFARPTTIKEATQLWVGHFDAIDQELIARLMKYETDKCCEVTVAFVSDTVFVDKADMSGEIIEHDETFGNYRIRLVSGAKIYTRLREFTVEHEYKFPVWMTMWSFSESKGDCTKEKYEQPEMSWEEIMAEQLRLEREK